MSDDEFEALLEEDGYSDIDDMSWKVRRCAAKLLYSLISTHGHSRALDDPAFKERQESVKLEVVSTLTALVRKTSEGSVIVTSNGFLEAAGGSKNSRKRRRQDSDASMVDFEPGVGADRARSVPLIVQSLVKVWKQASMPLRQAVIVLLKSLSLARYGGLADHLQQIEDLHCRCTQDVFAFRELDDHAGAAVSAGTLQIQTLGLISAIAETHMSEALLPFLIALVPGVVQLADLEVRQRAIHVFGVLLARTSGERGAAYLPEAIALKALLFWRTEQKG
ncbi:uncharacterized protein N7469_003250 [Penicillium citrinum]|uniref:Uncharacterized protein n=1 Tax=Penicillium citrinum TaxID=5077 RepID=A0A9W9TW43_PENCI|nr:uncharacterized protein N7469_003250 [Penicillium citrinum]KAJ5241659.1 hypothetical protein N7469_003250 [Penicillium citrinum]